MKRTIVNIIWIGLLACFANGQNKHEVFSSVPPKIRGQLVEKVKLLIKLKREKKYSDIYDILSEVTKDTTPLDTFIKANKDGERYSNAFQFIDFVPDEVYELYPDFWLVKGCGKFKSDGKQKSFVAQTEASLENNEWYFTSMITIEGAFGSDSKVCKSKK